MGKNTMYQTFYASRVFQSCYSWVHFYWIPVPNFTLLKQFPSKHFEKLQEIQSFKHVTKHEVRLLLYIHIADCMQKTVSSPTTSVVDISLFTFLIFSYTFQQWLSKHNWAIFQNDGESCWSNSYISIEYLTCIKANSTTDLFSVEDGQYKISRAPQFWLEGPFTSARIETKPQQRCMIRNARTGQKSANIRDIKFKKQQTDRESKTKQKTLWHPRNAHWCVMHIASSCPAFHPPVSPRPSWQGCSQSVHPSACISSYIWSHESLILTPSWDHILLQICTSNISNYDEKQLKN